MQLGYNSNGFVHHRLEDALNWLSELGYEAVALTPDVGCLDPREIDESQLERLSRRLHTLGLTPVIETGARFLLDSRRKHRPNLLECDDSYRIRLDFLWKMLEWCDRLGAGVLSFWSGALPEDQTENGARARWFHALETLHPRAEAFGVRLAIEPEPGHWLEDLNDYANLREAIPASCGLSLDVGHLLVTEETTPEQAVLHWREEIVNLQLDDMRRGVHEHLPPGEGELDWTALAAALREAPLAVPACFELSRDSHRFHELAPAMIEFVRRVFG